MNKNQALAVMDAHMPTPRLLLLISMAVVPGAVLYAQIRGYLRLLVGTRYAPTQTC